MLAGKFTNSTINDAHAVLHNVFGYPEFRDQQGAIIDHVIGGGDALVVMPTGAGKSLCYQIPAIVRPGVGVVVSPLIALMRDQVEGLRQAGVKAAYLNSTLSLQESRQVAAQARQGELDLLYLSPERLVLEESQELLSQMQLALFAIDEAHCVSQWGHDFRPEYLALDLLHDRFPNVPRIALTATADAPTRIEIAEKLKLQDAKKFISGFDRPNIRYTIDIKNNSTSQLLKFLRSRPSEDAGIVYCLSRSKTEKIASFLCKHGFRAYPYHAGLDVAVRTKHQDLFINEEGVIIVATIAFGMGIDKPNVRFVAHMDLPKSVEAYYQETGRAGRDGLPAEAYLLYGFGDVVTLRQMIESSQSEERHKQLEIRKLNALLGLCECTACRRRVLLEYFGDKLPEPCMNCDTCVSPPATWDGTKSAQMVLSCIYRTGQRFGAQYIVNVLRGVVDERMHRFGHDTLSTFGIGKDFSQHEWLSIIRQLVAAGYLAIDLSGYGGLQLCENSGGVLKGSVQVSLRKDVPMREKKSDREPRQRGSKDKARGTVSDSPLFEALRAKRLELSKSQRVPPYLIFHDRTLLEIAERKPKSLREFRIVPGVGDAKLERYGQVFLEVVLQNLGGA